MLYPYRLFISHAWKYGNDYNNLITLLNAAPYFLYRNYSAPEEKPLFPEGTPLTNGKIASKITDKISPTQIKEVADDIISRGYVSGRVRIGITGMAITKLTAQANGVPTGIQMCIRDRA